MSICPPYKSDWPKATLRSGSVVAKGLRYANAKRGLWPQLPRLCDRIQPNLQDRFTHSYRVAFKESRLVG
ncbi:MAG: hypothetical protein F6K55_18095 [Moorea sp. SIO4A3]|nr:hypothetical protein [Moorena sp. SIO4A3]